MADHLCPYCFTPAFPGACDCPRCGASHHDDCWADNGGCAVAGCGVEPVGARVEVGVGAAAATTAAVPPPLATAAVSLPVAGHPGPSSPEPAVVPVAPADGTGATAPAAVPGRSGRRTKVVLIVGGLVVLLAGGIVLGGLIPVANDGAGEAQADARPPATTPDDAEAQAPQPQVYGDSDRLDALHDLCQDGAWAHCDRLASDAPAGSEYSAFGRSCGDRLSPSTTACELRQPATQPAAKAPSRAQPPAQREELVRTPAWIVVINSVERHKGVTAARQKSERYGGMGIDTAVLLSSDYSSLNPGYWVVYAGPYQNEDAASAYCRSIANQVTSCYQRFLDR